LTGYQSEIHRPKRDIGHISNREKPIYYRRRRRKNTTGHQMRTMNTCRKKAIAISSMRD